MEEKKRANTYLRNFPIKCILNAFQMRNVKKCLEFEGAKKKEEMNNITKQYFYNKKQEQLS